MKNNVTIYKRNNPQATSYRDRYVIVVEGAPEGVPKKTFVKSRRSLTMTTSNDILPRLRRQGIEPVVIDESTPYRLSEEEIAQVEERKAQEKRERRNRLGVGPSIINPKGE